MADISTLDRTRLRVESNNRIITQGLIWELALQDKSYCQYTLSENDHKVVKINGEEKELISLRNLFLEMEDLTEYEFATTAFGSWNQWQRIQNNSTKYMGEKFCDIVDGWRQELELKLRARALKQIAEFAQTDKGYQAAKFMADRGWDLRKAGAPSKAEKKKQLKQDKALHNSVTEDLERLGMLN